MRNNLGAETHLTYASSTQFYLADKSTGRPWATRLPFPVHVVEHVETVDRISGNRFTTRYVYHHGYFDAPEREFRGFGMVEQFDTEHLAALGGDPNAAASNEDPTHNVPPVWTKTWFHTGAYTAEAAITRRYDGEYYRESDPPGSGLTDTQAEAMLLPDTVLPDAILHADGTRTPFDPIHPRSSRSRPRPERLDAATRDLRPRRQPSPTAPLPNHRIQLHHRSAAADRRQPARRLHNAPARDAQFRLRTRPIRHS
jgi:hypothetical protein